MENGALNTTFVFHSKDGQTINFGYIGVYTVEKQWAGLQDGPPSASQNPGIGYPTITNPQFGIAQNCTVNLQIDAQVVNNVPYASDSASLLFNIDGSAIHINIHSGGGMAVTGVYGSSSGAISWDYDIGSVGGVTTFYCRKNN